MTILSLVIPCYNEREGLQKLVNRCLELLDAADLEIILVNNGSTDGSENFFEALSENAPTRLKIVNLIKNQGYGRGILQGLNVANSAYVGWTHADLQTDPMDALKAIKIIEASNEPVFIKGKRFGRPVADQLFTFAMSIYESILLKTKLWDINAQPTIFPKDLYRTWETPPKDFSLDLFAYYSARRSAIKIVRYSVRFGHRQFGTSSWNISWKSKYKFIKRTIKFSRDLSKRVK